MKVLAVTGFVPDAFPAKHLSQEKCRALGQQLKDALGERLHAFDPYPFDECWFSSLAYCEWVRPDFPDPPKDRFETPNDMVRSNVVLLQRYTWLSMAARMFPDVKAVAWIEYTIFKQAGITSEVLNRFLDKLERFQGLDAIMLPGCWEKKPVVSGTAHWRFVGSCGVYPRSLVGSMETQIQDVVDKRVTLTGKLDMDMNAAAYVEHLNILPIIWYPANHDASQFDNFPEAYHDEL